MDKVALLGFIEDLGLDPEVEEAILKYIEANEVSPELMENLAKALEMQAAGQDLIRDQLMGEVDMLETMGEELKSAGEENGAEVNKVLEGFLGKVEVAAKKVASSASTPVTPVSPIAPTPMSLPVTEAPVAPMASYQVPPIAETPPVAQSQFVAQPPL